MANNRKKVLILPAPGKIEEARKLIGDNIEITQGAFWNIEFRFNCKLVILHKGIDLKKFDFIWLSSLLSTRDISRAISVYLTYHNVPHTNVNYGEGTSKLVDLTHFDLNKLPIPNTFFQRKCDLHAKIDIIEDLCGFPLIIKDTKGSRGRNSFLVNSKQELVKILKSLPHGKSFVFQQFIPNDYDWGILVANGKVVSGEKSFHSRGEFRNNACWGAKESFEDTSKISKKVKKIALNACNLLNQEWGRADIIIDKFTNEPYLLEVNRFPGMTTNSPEVGAFSNYLKDKLS